MKMHYKKSRSELLNSQGYVTRLKSEFTVQESQYIQEIKNITEKLEAKKQNYEDYKKNKKL